MYQTNYKPRNKQAYQPENISFEKHITPSAENLKANFLNIKTTNTTINKELALKTFKQLETFIDISKSSPKEIAIYIENENSDIFANITHNDNNDTYTVKINEGRIEDKKIKPFSFCLNNKGNIQLPKNFKPNLNQKNALNIMFESIIKNDSNTLKIAPKEPILPKEKLHKALIRMGPKYLKPKYREAWSESNPTNGYCYVVSEVIYHYLAPEGSKPKVVKVTPEGTHWWIETKDGTILDGTSEQFKGEKIPYHQGRGNGFLTKIPSERARILAKELGLIDKIQVIPLYNQV